MSKLAAGFQLIDALSKPFALGGDGAGEGETICDPSACQTLTIQALNSDINRSILTSNGKGVVQYITRDGKEIHQRSATDAEVKEAEAEGCAIATTMRNVKRWRRNIESRIGKILTKSFDAIRAALPFTPALVAIKDRPATIMATPACVAACGSSGTDSSDVVAETVEPIQEPAKTGSATASSSPVVPAEPVAHDTVEVSDSKETVGADTPSPLGVNPEVSALKDLIRRFVRSVGDAIGDSDVATADDIHSELMGLATKYVDTHMKYQAQKGQQKGLTDIAAVGSELMAAIRKYCKPKFSLLKN